MRRLNFGVIPCLCRPSPLTWRDLALFFRAKQVVCLCYVTGVLTERAKSRPVKGPCPQKSTSERDLGFRRMFKYHHSLWGARPLLALRISFGSSDSSLILVRRCSCIRSKNMWGLPKRIRKRYNSVQNWIAKTVDGRCATWPVNEQPESK